MPYKEKLKNPSYNPSKKSGYKVTNWSEYNKSLKNRGKISLYLPSGDIKSVFINDDSYESGVSGRNEYYTNAYIELMYILYRILNLAMRQITGFMEDLWQSKGLDIAAPSFGNLSDRFAQLKVDVKQRCDKLAQRVKSGESISLIVDSTSLGFSKANHWHESKYGVEPDRKPWKKLHLSMDLDGNIHNTEITEGSVNDRDKLEELIDIDYKIDRLIADGGYYSSEKVDDLYERGIEPVIPPPSNSVAIEDSDSYHDKIINYIQEKGIYAFHVKYDYRLRALVEAMMSKIKRCLGRSLKTQREESQENEGKIIANIVNIWNSFGQPVYVKIG